MTRSSAYSFTDLNDIQAALKGHCRVEFVVTGRGPFQARLIQINLNRLSLLCVEEWQPRVVFVRPPANQVAILLPWDREPSQIWAGMSLSPREILTIRSIPGVHGRIAGHCHSAAVLCPTDYLLRIGGRLIGPRFVVPPGVVHWQPAPDVLKALLALFRAAIRVTASSLSAPTGSEAARGLEQEIVGALAECLSIAPAKLDRQRGQFQINLMARFAETLRLRSKGFQSSTEVSRQLGIRTHTLRAYCHDHLGAAPQRYLRLHQLQQFHRELHGADPRVTTISSVARRHGISQSSRLTRLYRDLFGELPSATLRRPAGY